MYGNRWESYYKIGTSNHVVRRFKERFGIAIKPSEIKLMEETIRRGDAVFVRDERKATIWEVLWEGRKVYAVYHWKTNTIVTVLTQAMLRANSTHVGILDWWDIKVKGIPGLPGRTRRIYKKP